ncbi:MAG TPA: serine/threonine-protein kinase [Patescibacteria group bacterium]|jgi:outer membrane protein assembly factor BamB/tRNA A-37 threonylcarbamoyl transferase component Bud32|nr:serine/threonine-protein kinase [Patescibacteria group bacterium]
MPDQSAQGTDELTTKKLPKEGQPQKERREGLLQSGSMVQGRYQVLETLGVGGFSSVYKSRDMHFPTVTRLCAIKEMVHVNRDPKVQQMTTKSFEREAAILATLDHPAVPDVYDYFSESDRSYLIIEYIHGRDLEAFLAERSTYFPSETVIDWILQLCEVLEYLHQHKPRPIVFRDLKPSNIMLDRHGRIRLIDFNIAKVFHTGLRGTMIGTEGYSPPEQYRGESSPAGDIYALGATFHHILTRVDPRTEPPFSFTERPIRDTNPEVPPEFEAIITRCLAYNASERYQRVSELKDALLSIGGSDPSSIVDRFGPPGQAASPIDDVGTVPAVANLVHKQTVSPLWKFKCEDEIRSTAAYSDGVIYVGAYDNNLYALTADKGEFIWKYPTSGGIGASPHVYRDSVLIASTDGYLYNINKNSGRLNWRFETGGPIYSSPKADFEHVFFGSDDGFLYAVSATNGRKVWQVDAHGIVRSSPSINEDRIYFGTEQGYVFCLDLSGKVKWQFEAKRAVASSPAVAEDMVFVGSMDAAVYAVDANSGWALWRHRTQRPIASSPAIGEDTLYIGSSDGNLYALDIYSGRQVWYFKAEGQISSTPAIWEDSIYFGATDGRVYCLDISRGKLRWQFKTKGMVVSSPVVANKILYISSCDHHIYAIPV